MLGVDVVCAVFEAGHGEVYQRVADGQLLEADLGQPVGQGGSKLVGAVVGGVRDEVQGGELTVPDFVFDLAWLHVPGVVVAVGLQGTEGSEAAQGEAR
ncbi:MAG: hypothetical protein DLM62_14085 [Pseudonocardiales bacterium]|nr:MAG: hypothetical protein DLM62_14085 [Pseudonocardiales bacterium]